jgi:hypothetical protein
MTRILAETAGDESASESPLDPLNPLIRCGVVEPEMFALRRIPVSGPNLDPSARRVAGPIDLFEQQRNDREAGEDPGTDSRHCRP